MLRIKGAQFLSGDLQKRLNYEDSFFDCVACVDGIEHVENPFHLLREFHRVLRPDGLFVVSTPNISAMRSRFRFFLSGFHITAVRPNRIKAVSYPYVVFLSICSALHSAQLPS